MAVIVEERPGWRGRRREAFPEAVRCLAGNTMHGGMKNDPSEFAGANPRIEPFESLEFVPDRVGHPELAVRRDESRFPAPAVSRCAPDRGATGG